MALNAARQTRGLLTLLAISIDLQCPVLGTKQATRSGSRGLEVVIHCHCRMDRRNLSFFVVFETLLAEEGAAIVAVDQGSLVFASALDIIRVHGGEGFFLLQQIVDKGIHRQRGHPFPLWNIKGSTTQGARGGGRGVVSDQRIGDPQVLLNAAKTEGVEAGQGTRILQSLTTNGTVMGKILLKA